jgi:cytochrome c peroxidase
MSRKSIILCALASVMAICAFKAPEAVLFVTPKGWPEPTYDFKKNPLTKEKIALGRALFHDPVLSRDNTISCASCHLPNTAFTHIDHDLSHGIDGRIGRRNSPALVNLAWGRSFMWDGAVNHLDVQSLAPIENHDEMDESLANVVRKLQGKPEYRQMFRSAYGDTLITGEYTLKALAQFMLTFVSADSKYDKVMRAEASFNEWEAKGYSLFKANCASCHKEPLFTNGNFENNGLEIDTMLNDYGRIKLSHRAEDSLRFKVPTLRNVEVSYPYMHDGRFKNLQMVLFHYSNGIHQSPTLARQLKAGIVLSEDDKRNLIAFLKTLTDETFLHNQSFQPVLTPQLSTQ